LRHRAVHVIVYDVQQSDEHLTLLCDINKQATGSTRSKDSGLGLEPASPLIADDPTPPLVDGAASEHPAFSNDEVFSDAPSAMRDVKQSTMAGCGDLTDYVPLDVLSSQSTLAAMTPVMSPTGYVIAWTNGENRSLLPVAHLSLNVDVHSQSQPDPQDAQHLAASDVDTSCHGNAASTRQNDDEPDVTLSSAVATSNDAASQHDIDRVTPAAPPVDSNVLPYITVEQLQFSTLGGSLHNFMVNH